LRKCGSPRKGFIVRSAASFCFTIVAMTLGTFLSSASASVVTYVAPGTASNGSSSVPTSSLYTSNLGYAFLTGSSGPYDIDWVTLEMFSNTTATSGSFKIAIHGTTNTTAYSAVADATAYATDTVNITLPGTSSTLFTVNLTAADLPNISNYQLLSNTGYSLIIYNASAGLALRRTQGLASGTTNASYTVSNGFTMLDTFRNNTANYENSPGSFVNFHISFGGTASSVVPEPSSMALWTLLFGGVVRRCRNRNSRS